VTDASLQKRRHLALWFPHLSADRLRQQEPDRFAQRPKGQSSAQPDAAPKPPVAFVAKHKNALRLAAVDALGAGLGLAPGMTLADARVRVPGLIAIEADEAADRHWLEKLAHGCIRFSPHVVPHPPHAISIDIAGAEHLFGGEAGLVEAVAEHIEMQGMEARIACAATAEGALALARYARLPVADEVADEAKAIRALPVVALGLGDEATLGLVRAGLKTVGAVAARPRAALAARFGIEAVHALERLLGEEHSPGNPLRHKAPLRFERRFAEPVAHERAVAAAFAELLREAAQELAECGLGGRRFQLTLDRCDGAKRRLDIETGSPTRNPALVLRLFDERIAALSDPLDPGFGYDRLLLAIPLAEPLAAIQPALDGAEKADGALTELVDRLSIRLGPGAVRRLVPQNSHIPEQAQLALPATHTPAPARWPAPPKGEPPLRPLFLFDPPQLVEVIAEVPDGPPHRFRWRRKLHEVRLYEGPERIAAEWWHLPASPRRQGGDLTRDYYRIEDVRGRRYWLFRHGLYEEKPQPKWYLHGLFA
jgi:protein ImuB